MTSNHYLNSLECLSKTDSKYFIWYCNIISRSISRVEGVARKDIKKTLGYVEAHHILPSCVCDDVQRKDTANLAYLTAREHFICHILLAKFAKENTKFYYQMLNAIGKFACNSPVQERNLTSRHYEIIRKSISEAASYFAKTRTREKHSEETKQKMREKRLGYKYPTDICPHCKIVASNANLNKWHMDNCKQNPDYNPELDHARKNHIRMNETRNVSSETKKKISETLLSKNR